MSHFFMLRRHKSRRHFRHSNFRYCRVTKERIACRVPQNNILWPWGNHKQIWDSVDNVEKDRNTGPFPGVENKTCNFTSPWMQSFPFPLCIFCAISRYIVLLQPIRSYIKKSNKKRKARRIYIVHNNACLCIYVFVCVYMYAYYVSLMTDVYCSRVCEWL